MELSIRLEAIAACVKPGITIADIGTDHGYLPIELIRRGICPKVMACDVRKGPLERAQEHIVQAGLSPQIDTLLSNGFEKIQPGQAEGCVIAGMGGMLVKEILEAESLREKNMISGMKQMILQPQSDYEAVRRMVHRLSFRIMNELMLIDRDKTYWILVCEPGQEVFEKEWQYRYGRCLTERKDPVLYEYLQHKYNKNAELIENLHGSDSEAAQERLTSLRCEQNELTEVLTLWN